MANYNHYEKGMRFGKLTLIRRTENLRIWECVCDCGDFVYTQIAHGSRACKKCAYKINAKNRTIHGESNVKFSNCTRLYRIWSGIKTRCTNQNNHSYKNYGLRGVKLCESWNSFLSFREWSLGNGYSENLELDRIDNNGNYEPTNCRWATRKEQAGNTRKNRVITIDGKTMIFADWLIELGLYKSNVYLAAKRRNITVEQYLEIRYNNRKENT